MHRDLPGYLRVVGDKGSGPGILRDLRGYAGDALESSYTKFVTFCVPHGDLSRPDIFRNYFVFSV